MGLCWAHVSHKNIRLPYSASIWLPNSGLRFSCVWFTSSSLERVLPSRASSGSLSAERAPARRALSEMDPRSALKGGSANEPLTARGYRAGFLFSSAVIVWLVRACFLPVFLFWVWIGVFGGWGEALGKPWKTGLVGMFRNQGLFWAGFWNLAMKMPGPVCNPGGGHGRLLKLVKSVKWFRKRILPMRVPLESQADFHWNFLECAGCRNRVETG